MERQTSDEQKFMEQTNLVDYEKPVVVAKSM